MVNKENPVAEEPCRCRPNLQCFHINCEFCEKLPTCDPGSGLEDDPGEVFQQETKFNGITTKRCLSAIITENLFASLQAQIMEERSALRAKAAFSPLIVILSNAKSGPSKCTHKHAQGHF